jgi:dCMP deaminase
MTENIMRISWDDLWLEMAHLVGQRTQCSRAQYGAVIVSNDNRILSIGYNGVPAGNGDNPLRGDRMCDHWCQRAMTPDYKDVDPNYYDCDAVHAEMNALLRVGNLWLEKAPKLYVNGVTCHRCALTIANSGIKTVIMARNEYEEKRDPDAISALFHRYDIHVLMTERTWD